MISGCHAPIRDLSNQFQGKFIGIRNTNRSLAVFEPGLIQLFRKKLHCFRSWVQADMLLLCCKVNDILAFSVGQYRPWDFFCRVRQTADQRLPHTLEKAGRRLPNCRYRTELSHTTEVVLHSPNREHTWQHSQIPSSEAINRIAQDTYEQSSAYPLNTFSTASGGSISCACELQVSLKLLLRRRLSLSSIRFYD